MSQYYLKKMIIISATLLLATTQSCRKESFHKQQNGYLIPLESNSKTNNQYLLFCFLGHNKSECQGCLYIHGVWTHVDCQGAGKACSRASNISLSYNTNNELIANTLDTFGLTDLDVLNMPAQSFSLEIDKNVYYYLNIPAQTVYRDTATLQFTFTGLSFTSTPAYSNN